MTSHVHTNEHGANAGETYEMVFNVDEGFNPSVEGQIRVFK